MRISVSVPASAKVLMPWAKKSIVRSRSPPVKKIRFRAPVLPEVSRVVTRVTSVGGTQRKDQAPLATSAGQVNGSPGRSSGDARDRGSIPASRAP